MIGGSDLDHAAYEEETWKGIRIGGTDFKVNYSYFIKCVYANSLSKLHQ